MILFSSEFPAILRCFSRIWRQIPCLLIFRFWKEATTGRIEIVLNTSTPLLIFVVLRFHSLHFPISIEGTSSPLHWIANLCANNSEVLLPKLKLLSKICSLSHYNIPNIYLLVNGKSWGNSPILDWQSVNFFLPAKKRISMRLERIIIFPPRKPTGFIKPSNSLQTFQIGELPTLEVF